MKRAFRIPSRSPGDAAALTFTGSPWLAPLAGYSDLPFRLLCREYGAKVCETEMVSSRGLVYQTQGTGKLLSSVPEDRPLVVQLFGGDPRCMGEAVLRLRRLGYDAFDCNMGCPVRKVMRQKAGAALMGEPELALEMAGAMLAAARAEGEDLPFGHAAVGFKLRLDPERKESFIVDFGRRLEDMGASWLCLHPRTAKEGFGGEAHWREIEALARAVAIPVIASGDLSSAEAGMACLLETGAATVMYARGSLRNPRIFSQHLGLLGGSRAEPVSRQELRAMVGRHVELARQYCGDRQAFVKMRSIIPRYVRDLPGVNILRQRLCQCTAWADLDSALKEFLERGP